MDKRDWPDIEAYAMLAGAHEHHATFYIFMYGDDDVPTLEGFVKWDGCSNWRTGTDGDYNIHCCGVEGIRHLGEAMARCHAWAAEVITKWDDS